MAKNDPAAKKDYTVRNPLRVDAETLLEAGDKVSLTDKEAAELISCGAIERPRGKANDEPK